MQAQETTFERHYSVDELVAIEGNERRPCLLPVPANRTGRDFRPRRVKTRRDPGSRSSAGNTN